VLTDARGVPLGVAVDGANAHDQTLVEETLSSIPVRRPRPAGRRRQHLCCDKGYDAESVRRAAKRRRYVPHIRCRGDEAQQKRRRGAKARRWVVERTHSWLNRSRRLLIRWEKKAANYIAFLHLHFAYVALRVAGVIG
jgi:putative transposase